MTASTLMRKKPLTNTGQKKGILGADMESAVLFVTGALRGLKTGAVLNTVVEKKEILKEISMNMWMETR